MSCGGVSELGVLARGCLGDACPRRTRAHLSQLRQRPSNGEHTSPQGLVPFPFKEPGPLGETAGCRAETVTGHRSRLNGLPVAKTGAV